MVVAVNKAEGMSESMVVAEFHELSLGHPVAISASHGEGVRHLIHDVLGHFPDVEDEPEVDHPKFAIVGRPNVGKSTLVNAVLGEERVIAFVQEPRVIRSTLISSAAAGILSLIPLAYADVARSTMSSKNSR